MPVIKFSNTTIILIFGLTIVGLCGLSTLIPNRQETKEQTEIIPVNFREQATPTIPNIPSTLVPTWTSIVIPTNTVEPTIAIVETVTSMPTETAIPISAGNCSAAYPDFCIPAPPPDLDCDDIPQKEFTVLQPDPHKFDREQDGIGCEGE